MGYELAVPIIFWYLLIRVWIDCGRKIPLNFIGLWAIAVFAFPALHLPALASSLTVIFLAIILYLIHRYTTALASSRTPI
jgi:hypothetical protein